MTRDLTDLEIAQLLQNEHYGHIACCIDPTRPYLVPITYVYTDGTVYCFSCPGEKIEMMRRQPKVCFQVEEMQSNTAWQSAMIWGSYDELEGQERDDAFTMVVEKFWNAYNNKSSIYFPFRNLEKCPSKEEFIVFAIRIEEQHGRHEEYEA